jgi:transposase
VRQATCFVAFNRCPAGTDYGDIRKMDVGIDWRWMSLDGAMTKAPLGGQKTGPNPTDRGKKGTKRSVLTDRRGVPVGVVVAGANVNDHKLVQATFDSVPVPRPKPEKGAVQHLCIDAAYDCNEVRRWGDKFRLRLHIRPRRPPANAPKKSRRKKARRWVVERTFSWFGRNRRLAKDFENLAESLLAFVTLACIQIAIRRLARQLPFESGSKLDFGRF